MKKQRLEAKGQDMEYLILQFNSIDDNKTSRKEARTRYLVPYFNYYRRLQDLKLRGKNWNIKSFISTPMEDNKM